MGSGGMDGMGSGVGAMSSGGDAGVMPGAGGSGTLSSGGSSATGGQSGAGASGSGGERSMGSGGAAVGSGGQDGSGGSESVSCPAQAASPGKMDRNIMVDGTMRSYQLSIPQGYDPNSGAPFIIDFHGLGGNGPGQAGSSPYSAATQADGVVMGFPSGAAGPSGNAWNVGPCCVDGVDDVAFAKAIIEDAASVACIDKKRVYAVGFSMGGGMSHYLACHAADVFAAVAPAAFDLLDENVENCKPSRPITVVAFRSTGDPVVPYDGGYSAVVPGMPITFMGAKSTLAKWGEINECQGSAEDVGDGCETYANCKDGVTVTLCTTQGGGHDFGKPNISWPILKENVLP